MNLPGLFEWFGETQLGVFMQNSTYAFPIAEMVHLLSLTILGGAILVIDLRLFGLGLKSQSPAGLAHELNPYIVGSLSTAIASGLLLLAGEPMKCYYNLAFRLKMLFLALAVLFYFGIQQRLFSSRALIARLAGATSLALWLAVGLAGRAIGLL